MSNFDKFNQNSNNNLSVVNSVDQINLNYQDDLDFTFDLVFCDDYCDWQYGY